MKILNLKSRLLNVILGFYGVRCDGRGQQVFVKHCHLWPRVFGTTRAHMGQYFVQFVSGGGGGMCEWLVYNDLIIDGTVKWKM